MNYPENIFSITTESAFREVALDCFRYQVNHNPVYMQYVDALGKNPATVRSCSAIPFLPVGFFKTQVVYAGRKRPEKIFVSSGTTRIGRSRHFVRDPELYRKVLIQTFTLFYGAPDNYLILALIPSPDENPDSSLAFMVDVLIRAGGRAGSGFYLNHPSRLHQTLLTEDPSRLFVLGLTYALLDFAEQFPVILPGMTLMETGGMKGHRKEMIREELHDLLKQGFGVQDVHSEYGMSELLSQAYSSGNGIYRCPPWMKVMIRDINDPLLLVGHNQTGGINIIDLANRFSCPFIATQDLGRSYPDGSFEVLGRFDNSDLRGCNLLIG